MKKRPETSGRKLLAALCVAVLASMTLSGCKGQAAEQDRGSAESEIQTESAGKEPVTLLAAAAASLKYSYDEKLIPLFEETYPWITVEVTYDSSGKLQAQIEEGMEADVFMSAAEKQMDALAEEELIDMGTRSDILENEIVLIVPSEGENEAIQSFEDLVLADQIAIGDPESVPAGQYGKEALLTLGLWDQTKDKVSLGTNVMEVLNWVAEGSADAGLVYATDAAANDRVKVVARAPEGSLKQKILYPAAVISGTKHKEEAKLFLEFLKSDEAAEIFEEYGFTPQREGEK